ncbi:MAG: hypothetical protein ACRDJH_01185 [Thermomicrobiales bacterium]
MRRNLVRSLTLGALVLLLGLGASIASAVRADQGTPLPASPSAEATPADLQALLATCPFSTGTEIPGAAGYFSEWGLGTAPVWLVGWGNPPEALRERYPGEDIRYVGPDFAGPRPHGWFKKALWVHDGGSSDPVTLRGSRVGDGTPLWFQPGQDEPTTELVLDPQHPGIPVQHGAFREWPSYLFFPATGCYELVAEWADGSWRVTIPFVEPEDAPHKATPTSTEMATPTS